MRITAQTSWAPWKLRPHNWHRDLQRRALADWAIETPPCCRPVPSMVRHTHTPTHKGQMKNCSLTKRNEFILFGISLLPPVSNMYGQAQRYAYFQPTATSTNKSSATMTKNPWGRQTFVLKGHISFKTDRCGRAFFWWAKISNVHVKYCCRRELCSHFQEQHFCWTINISLQRPQDIFTATLEMNWYL